MPSLQRALIKYYLPSIKLFNIKNNYLPLVKLFTIDKNSLPLIKIFSVDKIIYR